MTIHDNSGMMHDNRMMITIIHVSYGCMLAIPMNMVSRPGRYVIYNRIIYTKYITPDAQLPNTVQGAVFLKQVRHTMLPACKYNEGLANHWTRLRFIRLGILAEPDNWSSNSAICRGLVPLWAPPASCGFCGISFGSWWQRWPMAGWTNLYIHRNCNI